MARRQFPDCPGNGGCDAIFCPVAMKNRSIIRLLCAVSSLMALGVFTGVFQGVWSPVPLAVLTVLACVRCRRRVAAVALTPPLGGTLRCDGFAEEACAPGTAQEDKRPLVLVAEDNPGNYRLIEVILRGSYRLQHALNGQEAVEMFDRERPDIVLMDINMPVMDGYEALRLIRERDARVPVIALTAYAFETDCQKMIDCGFNSYMTKPINVGGIKTLVESHLHD